MGETAFRDLSIQEARALAHTVIGLKVEGRLSPRHQGAWMVRLADVFLQAGSWTAAMGFLARVPRAYLRDLPEDAEGDPELAVRALRVARFLQAKWGIGGEPPSQVYIVPGRA